MACRACIINDCNTQVSAKKQTMTRRSKKSIGKNGGRRGRRLLPGIVFLSLNKEDDDMFDLIFRRKFERHDENEYLLNHFNTQNLKEKRTSRDRTGGIMKSGVFLKKANFIPPSSVALTISHPSRIIISVWELLKKY